MTANPLTPVGPAQITFFSPISCENPSGKTPNQYAFACLEIPFCLIAYEPLQVTHSKLSFSNIQWERVIKTHAHVDASKDPGLSQGFLSGRLHCPAGQNVRVPFHWSIFIISTLPNALTRSRGEYCRVVGIHIDG